MFPALSSLPQFAAALDARKLAPGLRHYNGSLVEHEGRIVLATRVDDVRGFSRIELQRLRKDFVPVGASVSFPLEAAGTRHVEHEDPRLFVAGGKLWLAFVELNGRHRDGLFTQELAELGADLKPVRRIALRYGRNGEKNEKNWIFFDAGAGRIGAVYSLHPHRVAIFDAGDGRLLAEHTTPGIERWHFGTLSGGTPAVRLGDGFIHFFHGYVPHLQRQRRYWLAAAVFEARAPHACTLVSAQPLVWASAEDAAIVNPRRPGWNPLCIFPSGVIARDDSWLVSCGVNDSSLAVLRFTLADLALVEPSRTAPNLAIAEGESAPSGDLVRVRVTKQPGGAIRTLGEPGGPYRSGEIFLTTIERARALGAQIELVG